MGPILFLLSKVLRTVPGQNLHFGYMFSDAVPMAGIACLAACALFLPRPAHSEVK